MSTTNGGYYKPSTEASEEGDQTVTFQDYRTFRKIILCNHTNPLLKRALKRTERAISGDSVPV